MQQQQHGIHACASKGRASPVAEPDTHALPPNSCQLQMPSSTTRVLFVVRVTRSFAVKARDGLTADALHVCAGIGCGACLAGGVTRGR